MAQVQQLTPAQQAALRNQQAMAANLQARQIVLQQSYPVIQQVETQTFDPANRSVFDVTPANVGIVKGFLVKVTAAIKNNSQADSVTLTDFGPANLLQRVIYYDPDNQRHTETSGWHLHFVNTAKQGQPFLSSIVTDSPVKYGDVMNVIDAPATIAAGATGELTMYYWVPLAYSETDLTGAVLANVPQSKQRLKLEFANNNTAFAATGANPLEAIYQGAGAADCEFEEISYTVYQSYLDQLPVGQNGYILPLIDLSTLYNLENSAQAGLTPNVDFVVQYANLYRYLSTFAVFDNGGSFNAGTDVNYLSQRTANFSDTRKLDPVTWAAQTRRRIATDFPKGVYYCDNRDKPIYTLQYGNVGFVLNPKTVNQNARLLMGYEYFTSRTELVNAGTISTT
ncbi:major capsid protein [Enterobacteria phage PRDaquamarine]